MTEKTETETKTELLDELPPETEAPSPAAEQAPVEPSEDVKTVVAEAVAGVDQADLDKIAETAAKLDEVLTLDVQSTSVGVTTEIGGNSAAPVDLGQGDGGAEGAAGAAPGADTGDSGVVASGADVIGAENMPAEPEGEAGELADGPSKPLNKKRARLERYADQVAAEEEPAEDEA